MGNVYNQNGPDMNMDGLEQVNDFAMVAQKQDLTQADQGYDAFLDLNSNSVIDKGDLDQIKDWLFKATKNPLEKEVDANGGTSRYFYNADNQVIKSVNPSEYDSSEDDGAGTTYAYDNNSRLVTVTNALGHKIVTNEYSSRGEKVSVIDGDGNKTELEYDFGGRLVSLTEPEAKKQNKNDQKIHILSIRFCKNSDRLQGQHNKIH